MHKSTKAILALIGVVVIGSSIGAALGLNGDAVSFGFIVGVTAELVYAYIKA